MFLPDTPISQRFLCQCVLLPMSLWARLALGGTLALLLWGPIISTEMKVPSQWWPPSPWSYLAYDSSTGLSRGAAPGDKAITELAGRDMCRVWLHRHRWPQLNPSGAPCRAVVMLGDLRDQVTKGLCGEELPLATTSCHVSAPSWSPIGRATSS